MRDFPQKMIIFLKVINDTLKCLSMINVTTCKAEYVDPCYSESRISYTPLKSEQIDFFI